MITGILTIRQAQAGLSLVDDEDCVYLMRGGKRLKTWSAYGATLASIQAEAHQATQEATNGVTYVREAK